MHVHPRRKPADIVVALDRHRWPAGKRHAFDHIGIKRTLREEFGTADFLRLFLEHVDEFAADEFALFLGVGLARQPRHKPVLGIDDHQRDIVMVAEQGLDLFALVHAEQAVVDKHAGELLANRFVDEYCCDRAIDAARQTADHAARTNLRADFGNLGGAEFGHRPIARQPANIVDEVGNQLCAIGRMHDLWMEHRRVIFAAFVR